MLPRHDGVYVVNLKAEKASGPVHSKIPARFLLARTPFFPKPVLTGDTGNVFLLPVPEARGGGYKIALISTPTALLSKYHRAELYGQSTGLSTSPAFTGLLCM